MRETAKLLQKREELVKDIDSALLGAAVFYHILEYIPEGSTYNERNARLIEWMESENTEMNPTSEPEFDYDGELNIKWPLLYLGHIVKKGNTPENKIKIANFEEHFHIGPNVEEMEQSISNIDQIKHGSGDVEDLLRCELEREQRIYQYPLKTTLVKAAGITF